MDADTKVVKEIRRTSSAVRMLVIAVVGIALVLAMALWAAPAVKKSLADRNAALEQLSAP